MAKFNFGKNKNKDAREDEIQSDEFQSDEFQSDELNSTSGIYNTGLDEDEDEFFDDDFGVVDNPNDEDDLEAQARQYATDVAEPDYKAQPRWYEKGANIIIAIVIVTTLVVSGLFVFREPIRGFIGARTDDFHDLDLQGEVADFQEGVRDTLQGSQEEEESDEIKELDIVETVSDGEYTVGEDIQQGMWVADKVLVDIYTTKQDFDEQKKPRSTNVRSVDMRTIFGVSNGNYVVVKGGDFVYNATREPLAVNVGDTLILKEKEHVFVGKDLPEGFYTIYNTNILETKEGRSVRKAKIDIANPTDDEPSSFGVERKTTIFIRNGLMLEPSSDLIFERVSADGTYGGDGELLNQMTGESVDSEEQEAQEEQEALSGTNTGSGEQGQTGSGEPQNTAPVSTAPESTGESQRYVDENGNGLIKGSDNGIYHVPGGRYYEKTTNPVAWFKTVQEAKDAGYRAPLN